MDCSILKELFGNYLKACEILDITDLMDEVKAALKKLLPFKIGKEGQLQEWYLDYPEVDMHHRHVSQPVSYTHLDGFYTEYHLLKSGIVNLPKRAAYVTDPAELIFDTGLDIVPQYEHIFEETENCQRLPETIRGSVMKVQLFDGDLRQTKRMLEADYRTAIPQYYNHGIQFLIPVCLQNPDRADLALACVKTEDGSKYLGRTCLTLKMAYHNARLLAKIHSSWLYP